MVDNSKKIANSFNEFYTNIGANLASKLSKSSTKPLHYMTEQTVQSLFFTPIDKIELMNITSSLKNSTSGYDGINAHVLKSVINEIIEYLIYLINLSLSQGVFPDRLKTAVVTPVYKKGKKDIISNYRPVSVLNVISKLYERVVYNRTVSFVEKHSILYKNQYGFRSKHSTDLAVTYVTDNILKALDNKQYVIGVFMDLAKAFDTINHKILLQKLHHYGMRGNVFKWFESYLSHRIQYVKYNGILSKIAVIKYGVPQGSILGPLLFILYLNDLYKASKLTELVLFADDSNLFIKGHNLEETIINLNTELSKISEWFRANELSLNLNKTHYMIFSNKNVKRHSNVKIDQTILDKVESTTFLGVDIDSKLSWKSHIYKINNKLSKSIAILYRMKNLMTREWKMKLYNTFVLPHLNYCNIVWATASKTNLKSLNVAQKRALKIALDLPMRTPSVKVFKESGALSISNINKVQSSIFMFKYKFNMLPTSFKNRYHLQSDTHKHNTRFSTKYFITRPRTEKFKMSMYYRGPNIWNRLSEDIVNNTDICTFKNMLKRYIRNNENCL